ncbi:beta-lactamase [Hylemonella gracilis str. Niagara R]|uniref:Beta-lactamase n=1 Tax=Hylemonella gracilis str. Niagara R TaxID=1458275 RepID=A0A016XEF5_9BURK|nr:MBL fold metallo-hydrolase [Hylemonella gracilis]EYC50300.1 beta-lactamase [Hylemonella gracilis str. Niagara R]
MPAYRFPVAAALAALSILSVQFLTAPAAYAHAPQPQLSESQAGYYRLKVGAIDIIALSDGTVTLNSELLSRMPPEQVQSVLKQSYVGPLLNASVNAYLIKQGERLILVDAGTGELYGPTLNKLPASLKAVGYTPEQITDILVTHIHTDHTGGLMDGNTRVFPNATIHVDRREVEYWLSPEKRAQAPAQMQQYFDQAQLKFGPSVAAGKVKVFDGATELFAGIRSVPAYGHTPGHSFYVLESLGEKIAFWGDILHVAEVQLPHPDVTIQFDVDPTAAAAARARAFAEAAQQGYLIAPAHMSFPGVGHLRRDGKGYRFVPLPYLNDYYQAK